jgi:hypothetical protein
MPCDEGYIYWEGECVEEASNPWLDDLIITEPDNTDVPNIINPVPEPNPLFDFDFKLPELNLTNKLLGLGVLWIVLSTKAWK